MAVPAFYAWGNLGRPLEPATPIREMVEGLKLAFPRAAKLFSWYANDAHYQAEPPQDHTPYSATGWPLPSPQWVVFATDVMHRPDLGVDCNELFAYWLAEAKAGRMPWLKYMIWRRRIYDVRNGWKPQPAVGHEDHIHLSARTDHQNTRLGDWSITGDEMTPEQGKQLEATTDRVLAALVEGKESHPTDWAKNPGTEDVWIVKTLNALTAAVAALQASVDKLTSGGVVDHTHDLGGSTGPAKAE